MADYPDCITLTRIIYPSKTNSELRLVTFPEQLVRPSSHQSRSQLAQIVEYIRHNRDKFSRDNLSKLFIKKSRAVAMLIDTVFDNSLNWLVNRLSDGQRLDQLENVMEYVGRFKGLPNFARRVDRKEYRILDYQAPQQPEETRKPAPKQPARSASHSRSKDHQNSNAIVIDEQQLTHQTELDIDREDLNYCRSLERKTHKYSISPKPSPLP